MAPHFKIAPCCGDMVLRRHGVELHQSQQTGHCKLLHAVPFEKLASLVMVVENSHLDSVMLILGDIPPGMTKCWISSSVISDAFHSIAWAPLGQSDHIAIFFNPQVSLKTETHKTNNYCSETVVSPGHREAK